MLLELAQRKGVGGGKAKGTRKAAKLREQGRKYSGLNHGPNIGKGSCAAALFIAETL